MKINGVHYRTVWMEQTTVKMINQAVLPHWFRVEELKTHRETAQAIRDMVVRGAGAIGAAAAYGMAQVVLEAPDTSGFLDFVMEGSRTLAGTRPTAQNLFYGIDRVLSAARQGVSPAEARDRAVEASRLVAEEDVSSCSAIGCHGTRLVKDGARVLTHCNAGWLAFVDWGSALAPVYAAVREGKSVFVFADETRPWNQGSRLTSFELANEGISHAIIPDNAAGFLMQRREIDLVLVGADRIAGNGDVANKIGTFEKAVVAYELGIPFYVAAPTSTVDPTCPDGSAIPIEERSEAEVLYCSGLLDSGEFGRVRLAPEPAHARNPVFDVTPAKYITGIITQNGVFTPGEILKAL